MGEHNINNLEGVSEKVQPVTLPFLHAAHRIETYQAGRTDRSGHHSLTLSERPLADVNAENALHDGEGVGTGEDLSDQCPASILSKMNNKLGKGGGETNQESQIQVQVGLFVQNYGA